MKEKVAKKGMTINTANPGEKPKPVTALISNHCKIQLNITKITYALAFPLRLKTPYLFAR